MTCSSSSGHPIGDAAGQNETLTGQGQRFDPMKPLSGFRVIELHAIGPVPFAGYILAQLGAQVTRINPPADPQLGVGVSQDFDLLNSPKEACAIDLKTAAGLEALDSMLAHADVLLEGFRPGVLERLGLDPQALLARHPRLVLGRLSGWGDKGVWAQRAGHDINYLAVSGILNAIGPSHTPVIPLNLVGDFGGGTMHLLLGVLCGLLRRSQCGQGLVVTTSILAASVGLTPMFYGLIAAGVWNLHRENNVLDGAAPFYRVYRCLDERYVAVGAIESKFYRELLKLTGLEHQLDPGRQHDRTSWPAKIEAFAKVFLSRTRNDWASLAESTDACVTPVLDFIEASQYAHNLDNRLFVFAGAGQGGAADSHEAGFVHPAQVVSFASP